MKISYIFSTLCFIISRKVKTQLKSRKRFVLGMEKVLWLIKCVKSGLRSFVLEISPQSGRPWSWQRLNQDINWEQSMLHHMGDSRHTQNIQISEAIGENEKCVFYFVEKTKWNFGQPSNWWLQERYFFFFLSESHLF